MLRKRNIRRDIKRDIIDDYLELFVKIPVSELALNDRWFIEHTSKTRREDEFKELVRMIVRSGLNNFFLPRCDPSINERYGISYIPGQKPAIGHTEDWWEHQAENFKPECNSRLCTKTEYVAFLAVLIKKMVANGWEIQRAWHVICNDSRELGHYKNSENSKSWFEMTGSREFYGFCDLANTYKILKDDSKNSDIIMAGGCYLSRGDFVPLADLCQSRHFRSEDGVGLIVVETFEEYVGEYNYG